LVQPARLLYTLGLYALTPVVLARLWFKGRRQPEYRRRLAERFGFTPRSDGAGEVVWVHAVSVGETLAATSLIEALRRDRPGARIVLTTMTPTGAEIARRRFGDGVEHRYVPYDLPGAVARFLDRLRPRLLILMETELWPNLLAAARARGLPVVLANGRLSAPSARGYRLAAGLTREMLCGIHAIAAQTRDDADRFIALGAAPERVIVTGNLKFDLALPDDLAGRGTTLRGMLGPVRPVWIAASTHEGEEGPVLAAHAEIRRRKPEALLVLVPRHSERAARLMALCGEAGLRAVRRTAGSACAPDTDVYMVDTLGELPAFYAAADVAFVGGSLVPVGGHNLLEPAAAGLPVLTGPQVFNFTEVSRLLHEAGAASIVTDSAALAAAVVALLADPGRRATMGEAGRRVVEANRGATGRVMALIGPFMTG
jgi:3-deoxy-D-manno-octulosonic-acid transferase